MTTDNYDDNLILGYIEDELTADEKAAFEKTLATDPRLASLVNSMKQDRDMLSDLDQVTAPMELGDYVSAQLERQMLLGPLPERRKPNPAVRSTPQARSHARTMRIFAYGSLAAMFMVIIGLMVNHIGTQSLIHRTENMAFESQISKQQPVVAMDMEQANRSPDAIDRLLAEPIVLPQTKTELEMQVPQAPQTPEVSAAPMPETLALNAATDTREMSAVGGIAKLDWDESGADQANTVSGRAVTTESSVIADQPVVAMSVPKSVTRSRSSEPVAAKRSSTPAMSAAPASDGAMSGFVAVPEKSAGSPAVEQLKKHSPTMSRLAMGDDELASVKDKSKADDTAPDVTAMITGNVAGTEHDNQPTNPTYTVTTAPTAAEAKAPMDVAVVIPEPSPLPPLVGDTDPSMNQLATPPPRAKLLAEAAAPPMPTAKPLPRQLRDVAGVRSMTIMPRVGDSNEAATSNTVEQTPPVCIIQSHQPQQTVIQITQWALRNKVEIIAPAKAETEHAKESQPAERFSDATPKSEAKPAAKPSEDADPLRQVITLNIPANQVPVLVQWLNGQTSQSNNWIAPLPQANTANDAYQRLQQEMPLAPTLPLLKPDEPMQVQLMVVPDPRPQTPGR